MRTANRVVVVVLSFATVLSACQKAEQVPPSVTISVSPTSVKVGEPANLTWSASNATSCTGSGTWNGSQPTSGAITVPTSAPGANAYTLMCTGPGGSAANTATLVINPAPVAERRDRAEVASAEAPGRRAREAICNDCGQVSAITPVRQQGDSSGVGAVAGAVLGAVIGHQFGSGRGNSAATAGGAVAGGYGGYEAERAIRAKTVYKVTVAMDDGSTRNVTLATKEGLTVGAKVRVVGNDVELRD
jgi:outer membrane lipoprotein SlyB